MSKSTSNNSDNNNINQINTFKLIIKTATLALFVCCLSNFIIGECDGQIALTSCDSSRLLRCQQDIMRDLQASSLNSASIQYAVSGPPYSPTKTISSQTSCRLVRSNLDCLLQTTPNCYDYDLPAAKNTDYILRGKRFLEENGCNEPDGSWRNSNCYRSPDLRICEERYMSSVANANPYFGGSYNFTMTCPHYYRFKSCVDMHIRMNCRVQDTDMSNEYLIDKAADHTWRCSVHNSTSLGALSAYQASLYSLNNSPSGSYLNPDQTNYELYQQRQLPTYIGATGNLNLLNGAYKSQLQQQQQQHQYAWQKFQNPSNIFSDNLPGIGRYPTNDILSTSDRLILADNFDSGDCTKRAGPFVRECENRLLVEQSIARDSLDGITMERKSCW